MKRKIEKVRKQSSFCMDLMERLNDKIQNAGVLYGRVEYHTRKEKDIIRLRRELNDLRDMLMQYGYEEKR